MAFPATPLDIEVSIALGADLTADPGTWSFTDITDYVREDKKIAIRRGKTGKFNQVTASRCVMTVDNSDGRFSRHNPAGAWYGQIKKNTPLRVRVNNGSGYVNRFCGYVTGWPPAWDPSEADQTVTLSADGIMRRLGRDPTVRSPLYRAMSGLAGGDFTPLAYWPMEDPSSAISFASAVGGAPMAPGNHLYSGASPGSVSFAAESTLAGSLALPTFGPACSMKGPIPAYADTGQWVYQIMLRLPVDLDGQTTLGMLDLRTNNPSLPYVFLSGGFASATVFEFYTKVYDITITPTDTLTNQVNRSDLLNKWISITIVSKRDGSGSDDTLTTTIRDIHGNTLSTTGATVIDANFHGAVNFNEILSPSGIYPVGVYSIGGAAWGHSTIFVDPLFTPGTDDIAHAIAAGGHVRETADERLTRLCDEAGIPFTLTGSGGAVMGPQRTARVLDLLRDCAAADQGVLYEPLDFGLAYVVAQWLFNQTPAITLEYDQRHVLPPFEPTDDDRDFYNDVTAQRPNGAPMRVTDDESVADAGSYPLPLAPTVDTDEQARQVAAWAVALGSNDELQWPAVKPNLRGQPELIDAWMATEISQNLAVTGHPSPLASNDIVQLVDGYAEVLGSFVFEPTVTLSPATIYNSVGVWGLLSHELHTAMNTSVTSADIANTNIKQPMLETSAARIGSGYGITIGAEQLQVTAVAASTITFGATGTASTGSSGSRTPALPTSSASGNLILIFASTRNSGTGIPDTPASWTRLPIFPAAANAQVFGRIYDGVWSMPTVTYTAGAANEDTIAQSMRLAGKWHSVANIVIGAASRLNTSAPNITCPALGKPPADDSIILWFAWKQDDYTSVTSPGTEIQEASSTAGSDASQAWSYEIQTTATDVTTQAFNTTGGASAISRGAVAALRCDYQTVTVTRSINGITASHSAADAVTATEPMRWGL